ncbi:MAG TPA: hypothetical protein VG871_19130 [Vicinamibacterales bacterium]|nr:hypothetical protein [Vicinamibacterales bacterium]
MKRVTLIATALVVAVFVLAAQAWAQETNTRERSFITFSNTVEMPGVTLPAGTYVFRLADTPQRNVVQVLNRDESKVLGQWLFVQATRPKVTEDTVVMFKENAENTKPAIQYWYFPGEKIGKEFVYPKSQAEQIAARTGQKVRTDEGYVTPQNNASNQAQPSSTVASNEANANLNQNRASEANVPSASAGATGANVDRDRDRDDTAATSGSNARSNTAVGTSGNAQRAPSADNGFNDNAAGTSNANQASASGRATLPKTASELPLSGLIGLLALAGAFGVRRFAMAQSE